MLTEVTLKNFKGHSDTRVPLGQLTVLVGPNGSGKSSVLQAIRLLADIVAGKPLEGLSPPVRVGQTSASVSIFGELLEHKYSLYFPFYSSEHPKLVGREQVNWKFDEISREVAKDGFQITLGDLAAGAAEWPNHARSADQVFKINPAVVAAPASCSVPRPRVEFDGRNVAVALKSMKLSFDEQWEKFRSVSREIIPSLSNVLIEQVSAQSQGFPSPSQATAPPPSGEWSQLFFDFKGAKNVPSEHVSEGTLMTVALLAVLLGPSRPSLILLDDIEQTLHPAAQLELMRQIKALLATGEMKGVQIIATTHSPFILDELGFDQVQVFAQREDGTVATKRLDEHPDAARLRGVVSAGELWTSDPESSWVTRP